MLRRLKHLVLWLLIMFAALLVIDFTFVTDKERRASEAISRAGGRMTSIPAWPIGSEYRVSFDRPLSRSELDQLVILNSLRGTVVVAFENCKLSEDQFHEAVDTLSDCYVFRIINGQTWTLGNAG